MPRLRPSGTPIDRPGPPLPFEDPYGSISYSSELIFENIPGAPVHHASSIAQAANGDLLVTWYGGSYESSDDEALFLARRKKGQRDWEPPRMLLRNPAAPVGNAVIFTDQRQRVWIVWGRMEATQPLLAHTGWERTRLFYRVSEDNGDTWSEDELFPMDTTGWLPRNLPIQLATGELVLPLSDERNNRDLSFFVDHEGRGRHMGPLGKHSECTATGRTAGGRPAAGRIAPGLPENRPAPAAIRILRSRDDLEPRQADRTQESGCRDFAVRAEERQPDSRVEQPGARPLPAAHRPLHRRRQDVEQLR